MLAPPRKAKETHDDDGADIMARRNALQRFDAKKPNRSQLENNVEIPEMANAVVSYDEEGGDQEMMAAAQRVHEMMRRYWELMVDTGGDPKVLDQLSNLLFMRRKSKDPKVQELAFASQEETLHAILSVVKIRSSFLRSKNIDDPEHVLTVEERAELTNRQREAYDSTQEQVALQARDQKKWPQRAENLIEATGKASKVDRIPNAENFIDLKNFLLGQKYKRWKRHLQRVCGTEQLWKVLAFSGTFDMVMLLEVTDQDLREGGARQPARKSNPPDPTKDKQLTIQRWMEEKEKQRPEHYFECSDMPA